MNVALSFIIIVVMIPVSFLVLWFVAISILTMFGWVTHFLEFIKPIKILRHNIKWWLYRVTPTKFFTIHVWRDEKGNHAERTWTCSGFEYTNSDLDIFDKLYDEHILGHT